MNGGGQAEGPKPGRGTHALRGHVLGPGILPPSVSLTLHSPVLKVDDSGTGLAPKGIIIKNARNNILLGYKAGF